MSKTEDGSAPNGAPPLKHSSEVEVQSELDSAAAVGRCATDRSKSSRVLRSGSREVTDRWISYRFGELWVIRHVEDRRFKGQLGVFSGRNLEIFLDVEVKIIS